MMNMKHKLLFATASIALLSTIGLSACGKSSGSESANSKSKVLSVWTIFNGPASTAKNWHDSPWHREMPKHTGITVAWKWPTKGNTGDQAFNLLVAQKNLPDIIGYNFMDKADQYLKQGIIRDLTPDIKKKAPHYWAYLKAHPAFDRAMRTDSGKYYMFGYNRQNNWQPTWQGPVINETYLKGLGMKTPTNMKEWDAYIVAANKKYGAKFTTQGIPNPGFAGAFGAYGTMGLNFYLDDSGKVQLAQMQPQWKDYIAWMNSLYKRGLMDKDFETLDGEGLATKVAQGKVSVTIASGADSGNWTSDSKSNKKNLVWEPVGYPKQADGKETATMMGGTTYANTGYAISTSCPQSRLDEAWKWLDWTFSPKGSAYWNYGIKGESYNIVNGKVVFTKKVTNNPRGAGEGRFMYTQEHQGMGIQRGDTYFTDADRNGCKLWYHSGEGATKHFMPTVSLTDDEAKTNSSLQNTITTTENETITKFILGKEPLTDANIKAMRAKMNQQGLPQVMKIQRAAYARYMKR